VVIKHKPVCSLLAIPHFILTSKQLHLQYYSSKKYLSISSFNSILVAQGNKVSLTCNMTLILMIMNQVFEQTLIARTQSAQPTFCFGFYVIVSQKAGKLCKMYFEQFDWNLMKY